MYPLTREVKSQCPKLTKVIEFLEEEFEIEIDDEDMIPENLDSLNNLEKFIAKYDKIYRIYCFIC